VVSDERTTHLDDLNVLVFLSKGGQTLRFGQTETFWRRTLVYAAAAIVVVAVAAAAAWQRSQGISSWLAQLRSAFSKLSLVTILLN